MEEKSLTNDDIGAMFLGEEPVPEDIVEEVIGDKEEVEEVEAVDEDVTDDDAEEVEAQSEDEEAEPETVEIEVDSELLEVPAKYKDYFLRQQDYTTKTQEVAQQRKAVEVLQGQVEQQRAQYEFAQKVQPKLLEAQQLQSAIEQAQTYLRENVQNLSSQEIEQYRFGIDDAKSQIEEIQRSITNESQEFQQAQEQSYQELLNKGTEVLKQRIPGWGENQAKQVRDFALSNGFTEAEINTVVDPRQVEILYKASQYDALKSGAAPAIKKVQDAPAIKPKSRNPMPKDVQEQLNLRKKLKSKNLSARDKQTLVAEDFGARWGN